MPHIDYWGLAEEVAEVLRAGLPATTTIVVEEELMIALEMTPRVGVFIESRELPSEQPLAGGRITRVNVRLAVWVWCASLEIREAVRARDNLISEVEAVLLRNRDLNNTVEQIMLEGGELPTTRSPSNNGFISGGEIRVTAMVRTEV